MKLMVSVTGAALALSALGAGPCQVVEGDRILGADLATAMPAFASLNPAMEIGIAPLPGITRVFHQADLLALARANGITLSRSLAPVCFERSGAPAHSKGPVPLAPLVVKRGDRVSVTVTSGAVTLRFESEAESSGHPGDTVIVRNPENGARFAARVEDQGKVVVAK